TTFINPLDTYRIWSHTSTRTESLASPLVATTHVLPPRVWALTSPAVSTVATLGSRLTHEISAPGISRSLESRTTAVIRVVSPSPILSVSVLRTMLAWARTTSTVAVSEAGPAVATMLAEPAPRATTQPLAPTLATVVSVLTHEIVALEIVLPSWSSTVAVRRAESPRAVRVSDVCESETLAGVRSPPPDGPDGSSLPQPRRNRSRSTWMPTKRRPIATSRVHNGIGSGEKFTIGERGPLVAGSVTALDRARCAGLAASFDNGARVRRSRNRRGEAMA